MQYGEVLAVALLMGVEVSLLVIDLTVDAVDLPVQLPERARYFRQIRPESDRCKTSLQSDM